jgi:DnaJ family protein C protein 28
MAQQKDPASSLRTNGDWESWIDQKIREAQERGDFDNLPGKGKPLALTPNPYAREQELAFKVLKDAGYAPEWIELDKTIRGKVDRARATLLRHWEWRETRLHELADRTAARRDSWSDAERARILQGWQQAVSTFCLEVDAINKDIAELNLKVPSARFQRHKLDAVRELERITGTSPDGIRVGIRDE